ncbi:glycerophosphodiester phosphodiesterase family protein [Nitrincola tapanii]|uniref:Glycerophosphoryl diester phosphodiesterase n=1 Tax=Nitrincola tapanii TaxID=1708751 RepID=A0A5A9W526_9GAMM|nr:glycerophosphodiester phosphodiesterase family protein [Nitrincola tapanii]KAA0875890.1 glycerophosphoryl diester phosphodiesterase [Nitrincola tapanii]
MLAAKVIGHRGIASLAPENTLAGIHLAAELGVEWIELDVTLLGDRTPVLSHDADLQRCAGLPKKLRELQHTDLSKLDVGSWFSEDYRGEVLPKLEQALSLIAHLDIGVNLELKPYGWSAQRLAEAVSQALESTPLPRHRVILSCFEMEPLFTLRHLHPDWLLAPLYAKLPPDWMQQAHQLGALSLHCDWQGLSETEIHQIKACDYELYLYTCNDPEQAEQFWQLGVEGIFSDYPQLMPVPSLR